MAQQDVLDYIRKTPHNSNVNVVKGMLNADGCGDSSDFSTINVTVINNVGVCDVMGVMLQGDILITNTSANAGSNPFELVAYKGSGRIEIYADTDTPNIVIEGPATYDEMSEQYIVTGNCTFTVNPA